MTDTPVPFNSILKHLDTFTLAHVALNLYDDTQWDRIQDKATPRRALNELNAAMRDTSRWALYCDEIETQSDDHGVMLDVTGQEPKCHYQNDLACNHPQNAVRTCLKGLCPKHKE